jgi:ribosome-associated translation inhibitor RaiA
MNKMPDNTFEVKLLITVRGKEYFTDEADYLLETALVKAVDELERMLKKEKIIVSAQEWEQAREAKRATEEDLLDEENLE